MAYEIQTDLCECFHCRNKRTSDMQKPGAGIVSQVLDCVHCGTKTWHHNGVCEWADGHKN